MIILLEFVIIGIYITLAENVTDTTLLISITEEHEPKIGAYLNRSKVISHVITPDNVKEIPQDLNTHDDILNSSKHNKSVDLPINIKVQNSKTMNLLRSFMSYKNTKVVENEKFGEYRRFMGLGVLCNAVGAPCF